MSFIRNLFHRCCRRKYSLEEDCPVGQLNSTPKINVKSAPVLLCDERDDSCSALSRNNQEHELSNTSLTPTPSPRRPLNWQLDLSTIFSESFDLLEGPELPYDCATAPATTMQNVCYFLDSN